MRARYPPMSACVEGALSVTCDASSYNASFVEEARRRLSTRRCSWNGLRLELVVLGEPKGSKTHLHFAGIGEQARSWLSSASRSRLVGLDCSSRAAAASANAPLLRAFVADVRYYHISLQQGSLGAHGVGAQLEGEMRRRLHAHYALLGELMAAERAAGRRPVALLFFSGEHVHADHVRCVELTLESCGVRPLHQAVLVHYNVGAMLSRPDALHRRWAPFVDWARRTLPEDLASWRPRMQQAWWSTYIHAMLSSSAQEQAFVQRYAVCNGSTAQLLRRRFLDGLQRGGGGGAAAESLVVLGGQPKFERSVVFLEMARRGLLARARWSAARFAFCEPRATWPWGRLGRIIAASPLAPNASRALLNDAALVDGLCAQLPRVLDADPSSKAATEFRGSHAAIWRGTRFALTFESGIPSAADGLHLHYVTEKPFKPLRHLRPFVMLGAAGSLAILQSLGFRTFSALVDARYDSLLGADARIPAALDEAERLARLPAARWAAVADDVAHNARHSYCASGLRRELALHARALLTLAARTAGVEGRKP